NCQSSRVRSSFFPALSKHATTVLAWTSIPQQLSYPTCILPSFSVVAGAPRTRKSLFFVLACSSATLGGASTGSRVRLISGLLAPRPLDLCHAMTLPHSTLRLLIFHAGG